MSYNSAFLVNTSLICQTTRKAFLEKKKKKFSEILYTIFYLDKYTTKGSMFILFLNIYGLFVISSYAGFADDILELLLFSLEDLRKALRDQGSDLVVAFGDVEDEIIKVANQVSNF